MNPCHNKLQVVNRSCVGNEAQLVGAQSGGVMVKQFDWVTFFNNAVKIQGIKERHQFLFENKNPGILIDINVFSLYTTTTAPTFNAGHC